MEHLNACIVFISSRNKCIKHSLLSLWDNFNSNYNYPVYVHYFDDIYDDPKFREDVRQSCEQNVIFKQIAYHTPQFIHEKDLYYNRNNLWYVQNSFSINRKGYLHMCNFTSNMYGYPDTELSKYDFIMTHDDESGYNESIPFNPFEVLNDTDYHIGAYFVGQRLKNGAPHQGHLDTRVELWNFTRNFLIKNKVIPKSQRLKNLLLDKNSDWNFHFLEWCDTYVIKSDIFKSELWHKWITAVNESGGIYKYRWGDNEIISIFCHITQPEIYNFNLVSSGIHDQGKFRHFQNIAPGVKDLKK